MKNLILKGYVWMQIWRDEDGQDLIEYTLAAALIAFAAVAGMSGLATKINSAFNVIGSKLGSALT
jgi:Flp pilus assembly pilin Flp